MADLADLSLRHHERGKQVRIATKYGNLTKGFMYHQGISQFLLVHADGAMEAAPRMGYADMIADLSETGTTLRENQLRPIDGGTIIASQAVLIGNRRTLRESPAKLETLREMIELIEAHRRARRFVSLRANIRGESVGDVQRRILANPALSGSKGPGVVEVASPKGTTDKWFETNLLVPSDLIHKTMQHLRDLGGTDIIVTRPNYVSTKSRKPTNVLNLRFTATKISSREIRRWVKLASSIRAPWASPSLRRRGLPGTM